jgi:hypothetical protein
MMQVRTLIATVLRNSKGKDIYCSAKKVSDKEIDAIRDIDRATLEEAGFAFIKLISLEVEGVRGHAIFFEGHVDEMSRTLKSLQNAY